MKILRISLRNLASLAGTHTVDFTRDPLRATGLFSISGTTGSGKSTLLDALCLALYERTPRLNAVRGAAKLDDAGDGISQKDPANLLRRGTGEGFAEVAFVGVDGSAYTARWQVRRAGHKPEGRLQNTEMTLFRGDVPPGANGAIEQGGRKTEVLPAIAAKVGLSFEQFTRAVLLAQNDFATFLKAEDKERAEILQALTGTERFEAISVAVFARHSSEQQAVAAIENRLAGNAPLTPEARLEAEATFAQSELAWKEANDRVTAREAHRQWFQRLGELSQQATAGEVALREKIAAMEAAAPRRDQLRQTEEALREARPLRDAENRLRAETAAAQKAHELTSKAEEAARSELAERKRRHSTTEAACITAKAALDTARPQLLQARELDAILTPLAERLTTTTRERTTAELTLRQIAERRDALSATHSAAEKERDPLLVQRDELAALAPFAAAAAAWLHRLDHAIEIQTTLREASTTLAARTEVEQARLAAAAAERAHESAIRAAATAAIAAFEQADARARQHDSEEIARRRSEADSARTALRKLEQLLEKLDALSTQVAAAEGEIIRLKNANEADGRTLADLRTREIPAATTASEAAQHAAARAEAAVTDEAVRLREKLLPGQPCPVCGATDHPHAAQPPASETAAVRALRADCTTKEAALHALREKAAGLDATRTARLAHESQTISELAALTAQLNSLRAIPHEHPAAATILALPPATQTTTLATQIAAQESAFRAAEAADSARRAAEKIRDDCRAQRDCALATLDALEKRLAGFSEELAALRVARESAANACASAHAAQHRALAELAPLFAARPQSRTAWERDPAALRDEFAGEATSFLTLEKRLGELNALIRETTAALTPANEAVARAEGELAAKRSAEAEAQTACEALRTRRAAIFAGRAADAVEAELAAGLQRSTETRDLAATELEKASHQLATAVEAQKNAGLVLTENIRRQTAAGRDLDAWLAGFSTRHGSAFRRGELDRLLERDEAWISTERSALETMSGAVRTAEGALAVQRRSLDEHTALRPTTDDEPAVTADLTALRAALIEASQRRDTARAFILADDQRLRDNAALSGQLDERRRSAEPWARLNDLIGSADGAKFRSIAQRRTLDILLGYANAQLDQLATRYRLERLPESLNLIVIDRDMGDERRSVHSLSGGESFLVSLALALALASLTSNRLRIESLFIDEGFGSLDPETLNTAMNALMHLEAQGRKVGVISHVTEMADAIPVQIRVIKGRSGASRLIVPGAPETVDSPTDREKEITATIGKIAEQLLAILHREQAAGRPKISTRALREEIGCERADFNAARDALAGQVRLDGKSLSLA